MSKVTNLYYLIDSSHPWLWTIGNQPVVATAIHDGYVVREEVALHLALDHSNRRREEDPFTAQWTGIAQTRLIVQRSRFEFDLNRPREKAIYREPQEAWGLQVWNQPLPEALIARSLAQYDSFYAELGQVCRDLEHRFGRFVILDLHTYNHCRDGQAACAYDNPEINLGTKTLDRAYWFPIIDRVLVELRQFDFLGRRLDVRENVKFTGGHFARWIHQHFPRSACVLSLEVKKFFMNEWTHQPDPRQLDAVHQALHSTVPGILEGLQQMNSSQPLIEVGDRSSSRFASRDN
ncbi:N-formylglutamate amidohydrolase [Nostoc sp.]|uniref:N-formylglutamate amidohydrolase n=1 Tax=Nostoc sp. TaxID=1180 RepID=UPI00359301BF